MNNRKVFCVGLNKTGTSSLHEAFRILDLKSAHFKDDEGNNIKDMILKNYLEGNNIIKGLEKYEAFSDWDKAQHTVDIVKEFDKQYPGSKFILNTRDMNSWLDSREKHIKGNQERKMKNPNEDITWLEIDRRGWEIQFEKHYAEVLEYFEDREEDLLVFDVIKGDDWKKLCPFLNLPIPTVSFPKKNVASQKTSFKKFLNKLKRFR